MAMSLLPERVFAGLAAVAGMCAGIVLGNKKKKNIRQI